MLAPRSQLKLHCLPPRVWSCPMPFSSLQQVLGVLENHDNWKKRKQYRQLLQCWDDVVGSVVAAQTHPVYIQRQVLQVATSSAAWAQNLAFERQRILAKLNARLPFALSDIRFSTAHWTSPPPSPFSDAPESSILWQDPPPRSIASTQAPVPLSRDPQAAFQRWAAAVRDRSRQLPACSLCQCPTPPQELQRWAMCALCAAKTMKRSPKP
jgi:predicted nucleic acid-binding Zn ribbon protein